MVSVSLVLSICAIIPPFLDAAALHTTERKQDGLLRLPLQHKRSVASGLERRQDYFTSTEIVAGYQVDVQIGTPPQNFTLALDTGSSELWVYGPGSCSTCTGGIFDPSASLSIQNLSALPPFFIRYFDGTQIVADYVCDDISIGSFRVTAATLGVAFETPDRGIAVLGVGPSAFFSPLGPGVHNIIDVLASQGIINTRAYSVYLDRPNAGTGALILGGTDSSRYTGDLVALPIAAPAGTDPTPRLNVPWSSLSLTDSTGTSVLTNSDLPYPVVLDTASDFAFLPINLFDQLATYFDVQKTPQGVYRVSCDVGIGTLDFGFGDGPAVTISVPFSDVSVPSASANSSVCMFAFQPYKDSSQGVIAFGGTFLRSAYVQYNYDAMTISLAQASWDSTCDDCAVSI